MIAVSGQGATRLMDALEKLSEWAGSGAGSSPSGAPSAELVQEFESALSGQPDGSQGMTADVQSGAQNGESFSGTPENLPGPAESMPTLSVEDGGHVSAEYADVRFSGVDSMQTAQPSDITPPQSAGASAQVDGSSSATSPEGDQMRELVDLLGEISQPGAVISPDMLYRTQYLMGMLKMQMQAGMKTSQNASQGMENILRQQG